MVEAKIDVENSKAHNGKKTEDIYTQNLQGLWRRARDENSQIVVNVESDTTKLNVIIDKMEKN